LTRLSRLALLADHGADPFQFAGNPGVRGHDPVERIRDLPLDSRPIPRQPHREIAVLDGLQGSKQLGKLGRWKRGDCVGRKLGGVAIGPRHGMLRVTPGFSDVLDLSCPIRLMSLFDAAESEIWAKRRGTRKRRARGVAEGYLCLA
jgi:hypothetical protein